MDIPLETCFRGLAASDEVERLCHGQLAQLGSLFDRLRSCRVLIARPRRLGREDAAYTVRIDLTLPEGVLVVEHRPTSERESEPLGTAVCAAFAQARRRLQGIAQRFPRALDPGH